MMHRLMLTWQVSKPVDKLLHSLLWHFCSFSWLLSLMHFMSNLYKNSFSSFCVYKEHQCSLPWPFIIISWCVGQKQTIVDDSPQMMKMAMGTVFWVRLSWSLWRTVCWDWSLSHSRVCQLSLFSTRQASDTLSSNTKLAALHWTLSSFWMLLYVWWGPGKLYYTLIGVGQDFVCIFLERRYTVA